jgi:hypothetical protein
MFLRWRRIDKENRRSMWQLYGWFTALMTGGSCFGVFSWVAWMLRLKDYYSVILSQSAVGDVLTFPANLISLARANRWTAAFRVTYAIEFLCMTAAQLMPLDRMIDFATPVGDGRRKRWMILKRMCMAAVVVGNAIGLCGNIAAAVAVAKLADSYSAASAACVLSCNNSMFNDLKKEVSFREEEALERSSLQMWCEVVVLLLVLTAFTAVGAVGLHRVRSALQDLTDQQHRQSIATGRQLHLQILSTTAVIFFSFLLRSVFSLMFAFANQFQDTQNYSKCISEKPDNSTVVFCNDCFNASTLIRVWMSLSPEFQMIVIMLSSPIALLVALWGMTSKRMLRHMKLSQQQQPSLLQITLRLIKDAPAS